MNVFETLAKATKPEKYEDVEFENIDPADHPDYVDAYISRAVKGGRELTEDELDELNESPEKYDLLMEYMQ